MRRLVFNSKKWGGRDQGDNSQFWENATILDQYQTEINGEWLATVEWPDGSVTTGHFMSSMMTNRPGERS